MPCVSAYMDRFSSLARILHLQEILIPDPPDIHVVLNGILSYEGPEKADIQLVHPGPVLEVVDASSGWLDENDRDTRAFREADPSLQLEIAADVGKIAVSLEGRTWLCRVQSFPTVQDNWWPQGCTDHRPVCSRIPLGPIEPSDEPYAFRIKFRLSEGLTEMQVGGHGYRLIAHGPLGNVARIRDRDLAWFYASCSPETRKDWESQYLEALDRCQRTPVKVERFQLTTITPTRLMSFPETGQDFLTRGPQLIKGYASDAILHTFQDRMEDKKEFAVCVMCIDFSRGELAVIPEVSLRGDMEVFRKQRGMG